MGLAFAKKVGKDWLVLIWMRMLANACRTAPKMGNLIWKCKDAYAILAGPAMIAPKDRVTWIVVNMEGDY